jgi:hypothetical protein
MRPSQQKIGVRGVTLDRPWFGHPPQYFKIFLYNLEFLIGIYIKPLNQKMQLNMHKPSVFSASWNRRNAGICLPLLFKTTS